MGSCFYGFLGAQYGRCEQLAHLAKAEEQPTERRPPAIERRRDWGAAARAWRHKQRVCVCVCDDDDDAVDGSPVSSPPPPSPCVCVCDLWHRPQIPTLLRERGLVRVVSLLSIIERN
jgi:hypothetical protein